MTRKRLRLLAACALMAPAGAMALGVGPIQVRSALNQTLAAEIELLSVTEDQLPDLTIQLASPEAFAASGIERPRVLSELDFSVTTRADGRRIVEVRSTRPIREPFLNFLLELASPRGRLVREFTVFLDPPAFAPAPVAAAAGEVAPRQRVRPGAPPPAAAALPYDGAGRYGPVAPGQTLWSIAGSVRPDRSVSIQQMMEALLRLNPHAFTAPNVNSLAAGAILRVPAAGDIDAILAADPRARAPGPPAAEATPAAEVAEAPDPEPGAAAREEVEVATVRLMAPDAEAAPDQGGTGPGEAAMSPTAPGTGASGAEPTLAGASVVAAIAPALRIRRQGGELVLRRASIDELQQRMRTLVGVDNAALTAVQADEPPAAEPGSSGEGMLATGGGEPTQVQAPPVASQPFEAVVPPPQTSPLVTVAKLLRDPLVLAGGGAGLLLLIALAVLFVRRLRRRRHQAAEPELSTPPREEAVRSEEPFTQDPLERADLMLAVGNYQEAESTIRRALAASPMEPALVAKLLDIHFATGDADSFRSEAEKLHRRLEHEDDPLWQHAAERGRQLCPGDALFESHTGSPGEAPGAARRAPVHLAFSNEKGAVAEDEVSSGVQAGDSPSMAQPQATGGLRSVALGMADEHRGDEDGAGTKREEREPLGALKWEAGKGVGTGDGGQERGRGGAVVEDALVVPDLDDGQDDMKPLEPMELDPAGAAGGLELEPVAEPGGLDFELPDEDAAQARSADRGVASVTDAALDEEEDFVETKLDLASAYMDMGDPAGARGYLEEVMEEGSSAQKQRAEKLLSQMSG